MKDEDYILNHCDCILVRISIRQHKFDFLKGDGKNPRRLPVDAYYDDLKMVIEYRERQHTEAVPFFDSRPTVSGVSRGEQRRRYDKRKREELPKNGIELVELSFNEFPHKNNKRLKRIPDEDRKVLEKRLEKWLRNK